jgi:hypothetical protein
MPDGDANLTIGPLAAGRPLWIERRGAWNASAVLKNLVRQPNLVRRPNKKGFFNSIGQKAAVNRHGNRVRFEFPSWQILASKPAETHLGLALCRARTYWVQCQTLRRGCENMNLDGRSTGRRKAAGLYVWVALVVIGHLCRCQPALGQFVWYLDQRLQRGGRFGDWKLGVRAQHLRVRLPSKLLWCKDVLQSRGSSPASYPAEPLASYQINRQLSGRNLPPLVIRAFGPHGQMRT